jgi:hypothetical protein
MTLKRFASLGRALIVIGLSTAACAVQFHLWRGDFLRTGLGDWIDPYFLNFLLEHWRHALLTLSNPASPPMYYPVRGTLGFSCGLILFAPFYIVARLWLGPLPAYTITLFAVVECGTLALYLVFRAFMRLTFIESAGLTAFVLWSANMLNGYTGGWSQVLSAFLIPPILLIGLASGRLTDPRARALVAGLAGLLTSLVFVQDFYTGWLALLIVALLSVGIVLISFLPLGRTVVERWAIDRSRWFGFALGGAIGGLVFAVIYLPAYRTFSGFPGEQLMNSFKFVDPKGWRDPVTFAREVVPYESAAPFLLVAAIVVLAWLPWSRLDRRSRWLAVWFGIVALIVLTSGVKFNRYSVWKRLFQHLPGASAIRDPKRLIYTYQIAVALGAGLFLARLRPRSPVRVAAIFVVFLLVVQERPGKFSFARPVTTFEQWVDAPVAVDPACLSFVVKDASYDYKSRSGHIWSLYGLDAGFIALKYNLPTINGYSAWEPPDWHLANPPMSTYPAIVADWIALNQLTGVCEFDIEKRTMVPYRQRPLHP